MLKKRNRSSFYSITLITLLVLMTMSCQTRNTEAGGHADLTRSDSVVQQADSAESGFSYEDRPESNFPKGIINYEGPADSEQLRQLSIFPVLHAVQKLASRAVEIKDSLELLRHLDGSDRRLLDPADSAAFRPFEIAAYKAIVDYKSQMATASKEKIKAPSLISLPRHAGKNDSTLLYLPKISSSDFLSKSNFFFLGGNPLIASRMPEDEATFKNPKGNPEARFIANLTENTNFLFNSLYYFQSRAINIKYGPPLDSYDSGPVDVNGVGSLLHEFVERIPVFFLTDAGVVPAEIISINIKLMPESLGCVSDNHEMEFASSKNISPNDILAVYIPYDSKPPVSCNVSHPRDNVWTVDLNNDNVPDFACVVGTFEGIISDTMLEVLWYANVNGTWQIIDAGSEPDCT